MTALVTDAAGFMGYHVALKLIKREEGSSASMS